MKQAAIVLLISVLVVGLWAGITRNSNPQTPRERSEMAFLTGTQPTFDEQLGHIFKKCASENDSYEDCSRRVKQELIRRAEEKRQRQVAETGK